MAVFSKERDPVLFPLASQVDNPLSTTLYYELGVVIEGDMSHRLGPSTSNPPRQAPAPAPPAAWRGWQPHPATAPPPGSSGAGPAPALLC